MSAALEDEVAARRSDGELQQLSIAQLDSELARLGYRRDRSTRSACIARWMTGPRAGQSWPCVTFGVVEADTGLSAFNANARRDDRFEALQQLRRSAYCVSRGAIIEV
jgi:hypothetical protein